MDTFFSWVWITNCHRAKIYHEEWTPHHENQERAKLDSQRIQGDVD
jgi:hypothetical protein